jgi:hypothetical protein
MTSSALPRYFQVPMSPAAPARSSEPQEETQRHRLKPLLRLQYNDLSSPGARFFAKHIDGATALEDAVHKVLDHLYHTTHAPPGTRSVTLILRGMDGVAYTTGKDLDSDHKEIHLSTDYLAKVDEARRRHEILGVLVHEMVHCWQWNALGSAPGGLIEGVADWVRLRAGYAPPHWKREAGGNWDAGYQHTGYFLDYLEHRFGAGSVRAINEKLRHERYEEHKFWHAVFGHSVKDLWKDYEATLKQ